MRMVRSSGERTRDVKRRYAIRGGSIPPRAEQQEKSIFCNKHPRLKRYRPQKGGHRAGKFTLAARKDEQKTNNNRLKRFGQRTFFLTAGKTANKKTFHKRPAVGLKRRHSWQAWKASRGCNTPPIRQGFFLSFRSYKIDAKHLAHAPGSIPGLATILQPERRTSCSIT